MSWIIIERYVLLADLGQHTMDIENFFELWFHRRIVHILVRCPESVKEEVDGTHNLLLSREMLDKVCVLSGLEEVCIEENGILVRVEGS